ncbi:MAG TPA: dihydrolipoamide acetyltransferase family protein [Anaerolineae bacterium]|nr:dihydrolipoamide acetyltransferase family protein [Anaerolineae bacterium]
MATNVIMPQLGESVVEGTISRWLVQVGDTVEQYSPIMEVSTDKVDTEVPAPVAGVVLKLYHPEGATLQAGTVIAAIGQPGEAVADRPARVDLHAAGEAAPAEPAAEAKQAVQAQPETRDLGRISPVVARIAQEHSVDLSQVTGSGREGRITKQDVLAYVEARERGAVGAPVAAPSEDDLPPWERPGSGDLFKPTDDLPLSTGAAVPAPAPAAPSRPAVAPAAAGADEQLIPHTRLRKLIAEHMLASRRTSPHVTTVMEADMSAVVAHRSAHKAEAATKGVTLTFTPYFVQAVVAALKAVPRANAVYREDGLLLKRRCHIGMATAIDDGLVVPVIHDADELSLLGLARQVNDLAQRARAGQLKPDEIQGSTFTITNHGTGGSLFAMPIINQPNVGILGIGAIQKRPVVISRGHPVEPSAEDYLAIRPMVYLSFTFDHRVLDGAAGDAFVGMVKRVLEGWK